MNNIMCTIIHFDCNGYYSKAGDDKPFQWISREHATNTIVVKRSVEEVTYSDLVEKICRKIMVDQAMTKLKLSYIPLLMEPKKPSYIFDDEDVFGYLMEVNKDQCRSVLHVEIIKDVQETQNHESVVREDRQAEVDETNDDVLVGEKRLSGGVGTRVVNEYGIGDDEFLTPDVQASNNQEWEDGMDLIIGEEFDSRQAVKDLVEKAAHKNCFDIKTDKSTPTLYVVKCRQLEYGCRWFMRAAKLNGSQKFSIRTYNKMHTCSRVIASTRKNRGKGTPQLVASVLREDYPGQFDTPAPKNLISAVQTKRSVKVSYSTAWRGKKQARDEVRGNPEESYQLLHSYLYMLEQMNHGTQSYVEVDDDNRFKYLFIALGACIEGFQAMRKVIIVDGTFIKTAYGGVLIVATAQDGDRHHYPIAFGVVDGENNASWMWFMNKLKTVIPDDHELVFVSDRNSGIIKSVSEVYTNSQHGYCIFHLSQNVKTQVHYTKKVNKESVAKKFRECAQAYTESEFLKLYGVFRKRYPTAGEYLDKSVEVQKWARCYFPGERYNIDTTNCAESINSVFRNVRKYSLLPMLDEIFGKLAEWFNKHRKSSAEGSNAVKMVPYVENELHKRCKDAKLLKVQELNGYMLEYNVTGLDGKGYLVDLTRRTCTCKYFDIDRYPCVHAIAAASSNTEKEIDIYELCSKYYLMEQWALAYYRTIYPVPHKSEWVVPGYIQELCIFPPEKHKKRGRIQETRIPSVGEHGRRKKKMHDHVDDHNRATQA